MIGSIGPLEIGIVLLIAILVFGPKRVPELGHSLGKGIREFRANLGGLGSGDKDADQREQGAPAPLAATADAADKNERG